MRDAPRTQSDDRAACPNPFCDGYGNIDGSPSINGRSWFPGACKVGPHPPMPGDYVFPKKRDAVPALPAKEGSADG